MFLIAVLVCFFAENSPSASAKGHCGQTVDAAMPVTISPQPDTVFRIWFAFVRDDTPQREAVPEALTRDGFTAVEWGSFFLN